MEQNPGDIMIYVVLVGVALFIVVIALADLRDQVIRAVRTRRQRRAQRQYNWYARQAKRRTRQESDTQHDADHRSMVDSSAS